jgi:hypothetical protein
MVATGSLTRGTDQEELTAKRIALGSLDLAAAEDALPPRVMGLLQA